MVDMANADLRERLASLKPRVESVDYGDELPGVAMDEAIDISRTVDLRVRELREMQAWFSQHRLPTEY
jgi:hypothetical protein